MIRKAKHKHNILFVCLFIGYLILTPINDVAILPEEVKVLWWINDITAVFLY